MAVINIFKHINQLLTDIDETDDCISASEIGSVTQKYKKVFSKKCKFIKNSSSKNIQKELPSGLFFWCQMFTSKPQLLSSEVLSWVHQSENKYSQSSLVSLEFIFELYCQVLIKIQNLNFFTAIKIIQKRLCTNANVGPEKGGNVLLEISPIRFSEAFFLKNDINHKTLIKKDIFEIFNVSKRRFINIIKEDICKSKEGIINNRKQKKLTHNTISTARDWSSCNRLIMPVIFDEKTKFVNKNVPSIEEPDSLTSFNTSSINFKGIQKNHLQCNEIIKNVIEKPNEIQNRRSKFKIIKPYDKELEKLKKQKEYKKELNNFNDVNFSDFDLVKKNEELDERKNIFFNDDEKYNLDIETGCILKKPNILTSSKILTFEYSTSKHLPQSLSLATFIKNLKVYYNLNCKTPLTVLNTSTYNYFYYTPPSKKQLLYIDYNEWLQTHFPVGLTVIPSEKTSPVSYRFSLYIVDDNNALELMFQFYEINLKCMSNIEFNIWCMTHCQYNTTECYDNLIKISKCFPFKEERSHILKSIAKKYNCLATVSDKFTYAKYGQFRAIQFVGESQIDVLACIKIFLKKLR